MGKVLILTDGKAGHENQSKAFARALGCEFDLVEIHFKSKVHKTLSYFFDRLGIRTLSLLCSPSPFTFTSACPRPPSLREGRCRRGEHQEGGVWLREEKS